MCGIAGYYSYAKIESTSLIQRMINEILHRGPDDAGFSFCDISQGRLFHRAGKSSPASVKREINEPEQMLPHQLALGHCRYSVIDLTPAGHQPFEDNGYVLSFNGEIYNYLELREELEKQQVVFQTHSDTEVLLKAFEFWGVDCFEKFNGPFAVAILDIKEKNLVLARDKIGKSPLYFTLQNHGIYFSSEIKSLLKLFPGIKKDINLQSVRNFIDAGVRDYKNSTFWNQVRTLDAASYTILDCTSAVTDLNIIKYWKIPDQRWSVKDISLNSAKTQLEEKLARAVQIRMRADLPVGLSLSGGMDSSSLAAIYCQHFEAPISTYTVQYDDPEFNEEPYARAVAEMYRGKINYNIIKGAQYDMMDELDRFIYLQEEPFHSPVLYTDYCLQKELKARGIGVNINGAAGDELLAGYTYFFIPYLKYLAKNNWPALISEIYKMPGSSRKKFYLFRKIFTADEAPHSYSSENSAFKNALSLQLPTEPVKRSEDFAQMLEEYFSDYQMNYWMRSGNKTIYGVPIEPRNPFLDPHVVEFGFSLPPEYLIHHGWFKYVLRKAMENILPQKVVWRKQKMGFPFMLQVWLTQHEEILTQLIQTSAIPFVDNKWLIRHFGQLNKADHLRLWRLVSLVLWYEKMVEDRWFRSDIHR